MVDGVIARRDDGVVLDTDPGRLDLEVVHRWLSKDAYWALGRSRETVERSILGSRVAAAYDGDTMLAFARAVTDGATFGWLCDVYVTRPARGRGIGTWMVTELVRSLQDEGVSRIVLATADAHDVYRRVGFEPLRAPSEWMERRTPQQRPPLGPHGAPSGH